MKKVLINKKKLIVVLLLTILITTSLFVSFDNKKSFVSTQSAKATSSNVYLDPCECNEKLKLSEIYDTSSEIELKSLISTTKSQKIYKDYCEFLKNKGYVEYTDGIFGGFFKKPPLIKYVDKNSGFKFSYDANLKIKRPYILSAPFIKAFDDNKIAGIAFVYSNRHVISYIIEETNDPEDPNNNTVKIFLESNNGTVVNADQVINADSIIDWQCARSCAISCALDTGCWSIPFPFNSPCFTACWAICYDMCVLMP